ncbi:malate dehydrogenase-like [Hylaeus volcanicus]|uniref:malate dehydrogenase-like n=1 Tax=Hylaeus volcanicus TaxID=313075 RepID=UPI0023B7BB04|nr:malate dehydrogenase-like [Hylaeus volcanicus]
MFSTDSKTHWGRPKISLVGSGQIGSILGLLAALKHLGDVFFFDVANGIPNGKALDLAHFASVEDVTVDVTGSSEASDMMGSDVVIVTAGVPRKPGMNREDLLQINSKIIESVSSNIKKYCPSAFIICTTNPLDTMVYHLQKKAGIPACRVVGMAGELDVARFKYLLSKRLLVSVENINAMILGSHGDTMVPLLNYTTVSGISIVSLIQMGFMTIADYRDIVEQVKNGGHEIVQYLKTGSAYIAPAAATIKMVEAYLHDKREIMCCSAYLNGEYGINDLYVGVPVIIGKNGVESILEVPLTTEESNAFQTSVSTIANLRDSLSDLKQQNYQ